MIKHALAAALVLATASVAAQTQHGRLFEPKDLGLLEGPDRDAWQRTDQIMDALRIGEGSVVADLGAGGGWFTVRLARRVGPNGHVFAEDIQKQMLDSISRRVEREGNLSKRVTLKLGTAKDPNLPAGVLDAALIVDAYHEMADPVVLLRNLARSLKPGGRIGIVEFTNEGSGPGPRMDERVDPQQVISAAEAAGLRLTSRERLRYQYLLIFERAESTSSASTR
jgi:ubiquinone/menaquinone biosynthesis C-methylase UbiE